MVDLDREQQEVVDYDDSCVVVAGPGSGKTRTLVEKARRLWERGSDLVCLTFTRAAAKEMRDRMPGIRASTIHSFCYSYVNWPGNYDKLLHKFVSRNRDKFEYVLIDEVQDLNETQMQVVLSIIGGKFFAVGDPCQSIYGWNGALGAEAFKILGGHKVFYLRNNYRSVPKIVNWLNRVYDRKLVSRGVIENGLTAILCRTNADVSRVTETLKSRGIGFTVRIGASELSPTREEYYGSDKLKVMTCHCSKGLEFDRVILFSWFPEPFWGEELNLYYVSISRASKDFCQVWSEAELLRALEVVK